MSVPEINGKPAAFAQVTVEDKINIGNFQNVTFTATVGRYVEDEPSVIDSALKNLSNDHCEPFLAEQRQAVLDSLSG
jgi:hypothetical protein